MLSETIIEFVNSVRDDKSPFRVQVSMAPEDCFAFLSFVAVFWRWRTPGPARLN